MGCLWGDIEKAFSAVAKTDFLPPQLSWPPPLPYHPILALLLSIGSTVASNDCDRLVFFSLIGLV